MHQHLCCCETGKALQKFLASLALQVYPRSVM